MATSSSSSRLSPSRERPPLYQKLGWPVRFSERHYSGKRLALNFSHSEGYPVLFAKHPFRLQRSDESSGQSQTAPTKLQPFESWRLQCPPFFWAGTHSCTFLQPWFRMRGREFKKLRPSHPTASAAKERPRLHH